MFNIVSKEIKWGEEILSIETGKIARQANGSVIVKYGETVVLCTATAAKSAKEDADFFPLTVNYQEKYYAAGKIPGGFFKRESRATEKETLTSRLIDRPIRPMFHKGYKNETQIMCTVLSFDKKNDADIISMIGASAALAISEIPFLEPIAGVKVGYRDGEYLLNPTIEEITTSDLDLTIAGTENSVLMVESEVDELTEEQMLGAVEFAQDSMKPVISMINDLAKEIGKEKWEVQTQENNEEYKEIYDKYSNEIGNAYNIIEKQERATKLGEITENIIAQYENQEHDNINQIKSYIKDIEKEVVRGRIFEDKRIDGRPLNQVRQISTEVGLLARTHGSALFTRGETQALAVVTLGSDDDAQLIDSIEGNSKDRFMLHYNFPPYSVGEVGMLRGPGRREIGHGKLAKRALSAIIPSQEEFPYVIRIVSEITESNGSSSMATVCASSMALMNAGVPMREPVAGIAMGLVKEGDKYKILSDIMGDEDHLGDMDFKVAGTKNGITSLQMDIKIQGITYEIFKNALSQAKEGRMHILSEMSKTLTTTNTELSQYVPVMEKIKIAEKKIREVIGQGGKVIKKLCEDSGAKISIEDNGEVTICGENKASADLAIKLINEIVAEPEIGKIYDGVVQKITNYGAFVGFMGNHSGLIHISEFADKRVDSVEEFVNEGSEIKFKVIGREGDKLRLSYKAALEETA